MRFGLMACIHSNLPALEAVLRDSGKQGCDSMLCLGDVVGLAEYPAKECIQLVRSRCSSCVKGNNDEYCATSYPLNDFHPKARERVEKIRTELSPDDRKWLAALPYQLDVADFTIVHASLANPEHWTYIFGEPEARTHFKHQSSVLCFYAHTHVPMVHQLQRGKGRMDNNYRLTFEKGAKYLVNVGAVDRQRDGGVGATYVIYDTNSRLMKLRRVDYETLPSEGQHVVDPAGDRGPTSRLAGTVR